MSSEFFDIVTDFPELDCLPSGIKHELHWREVRMRGQSKEYVTGEAHAIFHLIHQTLFAAHLCEYGYKDFGPLFKELLPPKFEMPIQYSVVSDYYNRK